MTVHGPLQNRRIARAPMLEAGLWTDLLHHMDVWLWLLNYHFRNHEGECAGPVISDSRPAISTQSVSAVRSTAPLLW